MRIVDRETVLENMSSTRTVQNFGTLLKEKPHKLGQVVSMKPELSISILTDGLRNVYQKEKSGKSSFSPINSMIIQWEIQVNFLKRVKITGNVSADGAGGDPVTITLAERYYDKHDTFALENRQLLYVTKAPVKKGNQKWEYTVVLVGNDSTRKINTAYGAAGKMTRWISNYHPELSERGYSKFMYNTETHRNYISRHRASADWSADYAMMQDIYIADGKKDNETYYKLNKAEKDCLDNYLMAREQSLLFSESNYDINGKCTLQDEKGRDIPMGDGIIPQITKVCDKFTFSNMTIDMFEDAMAALIEKSEKKLGNTWTMVCNDKFWFKFNKLMKNDLRFKSTDQAYYWSKAKGNVKVGATFDSYEFAGNTIVIMLDSILSIQYDDRAFAILIDTGKDEMSGRPNIALFTLEGSELVSGTVLGLGGISGTESGIDLATSVHGSSYHLLGYSGAVVFNPYKSVMMEESVGA